MAPANLASTNIRKNAKDFPLPDEAKELLRRKTGILNHTRGSGTKIHASPSPDTFARLRPLQTGLRPSTIEGRIINTLISLKNFGLTEGSLRTVSYSLKLLARNCDLDDSETIHQLA